MEPWSAATAAVPFSHAVCTASTPSRLCPQALYNLPLLTSSSLSPVHYPSLAPVSQAATPPCIASTGCAGTSFPV